MTKARDAGTRGRRPVPIARDAASRGGRFLPPAALLLLGLLAACAGAADDPLADLGRAGFTVIAADTVEGVPEAEVSYPSDGLTVRAFVFVPAGTGPRPIVVFNHGGVSGVSADMRRRSRDLARAGYAVITPAYRGEGGSEGVVEVARGEIDDVLAAAERLGRWSRGDSSRTAMIGSSHGALISVLAAAREPDRLRCVVSACGVMDVVGWYRYLVENGFDVGDSLSVAVYGHGPEDKPEAFRVRSAVAAADRIRVPLLLQQGQMDRIVPPDQARLMRDALHAAGRKDVALEEYPLLGHAFWFWNDPRYHTAGEIAQAEEAWKNCLAFLERNF